MNSMRLIVILVILAVGLPSFCHATNDPRVGSMALLTKVLDRDFAGDPSARIGKVIFSRTGRKGVVPLADGVRPAIYFLDSDPLVLVSSWEPIGDPRCKSATQCAIAIRFVIVAATRGFGVPSWDNTQGREIAAFPSPVAETVTIQLRYVEGKWKIVDPPLPRVSVAALNSFLKSEFQRYSSPELQAANRKAGGHAEENNLAILEWVKRQLDVCARLMPRD